MSQYAHMKQAEHRLPTLSSRPTRGKQRRHRKTEMLHDEFGNWRWIEARLSLTFCSAHRSWLMARAICLAVWPALSPSSSSTASRLLSSAARPSTSPASSSGRSVRLHQSFPQRFLHGGAKQRCGLRRPRVRKMDGRCWGFGGWQLPWRNEMLNISEQY